MRDGGSDPGPADGPTLPAPAGRPATDANRHDPFSTLQAALAGKFSIERELGRGGMGVVYLARDVALDRQVAIKVLPDKMAADPDRRERFLREARTAAGLSHPNIVPIHLVEAREDLVCFIMGYIHGETLGDRVRRSGPLPPNEVTRILREVAWALGYAHGRGVIHRDIKPDNILLEHGTGRALVTDFGIAKVSAQDGLTREEQVLGTLQYMPPEQADSNTELDGRSDLYALGVTAFFTLTGRLPFESASAPALLAMHLSEPAPPVTSLRPGIPPRLAEAVARCLAKEPSARFPNAEALADALGEMAVARAVPPSILAFREAAAKFGQAAVLPGALYYILGMELFPPWAPALATVWAILLGWATLELFLSVRAVVRAGHNPKDVADASVQIRQASLQDRNAAVFQAQAKSLDKYIEGTRGRVLFAGGATLCFAALGLFLKEGVSGDPDAFFGAFLSLVMGIISLATAFHLGPEALWDKSQSGRERRLGVFYRWLKRFWDNPLMRALFRIAGLGASGTERGSEVVEQGATEVVLGKAVEELFSGLPKADRARLQEVPQVIKELEAAAATLRNRRDELERAIADVGLAEGSADSRKATIVNELEKARDRASERLQRVVAALEDLRLDLLRLRAGIGEAAEITGAVEAARQVGAAISAELEGRAEVQRLVEDS